MPTKNVTAFEHTTLHFDNTQGDQKRFNALVSFNQLHGNKYFSVGRSRVTFHSHVGVIQAGDLVLEILPKTANVDNTQAQIGAAWRKALPRLLSRAGYIKLDNPGTTRQHAEQRNLMDVLLFHFLNLTDKLVHAGLVKQYRRHASNSRALKGRLLFSQQLWRNLIRKDRFYTEHETYDRNNVYNQVLKKALQLIANRSKNSALISRARQTFHAFSGVDLINVTEQTFNSLKYHRKTKHYESAIDMARLIILHCSPQVQAGPNKVLAVLFDMNTLFERYIYSLLKNEEKHFTTVNLKVTKQASAKFWRKKTIRPDVVIEFDIGTVRQKVMVDTKWKMPKKGSPDNDDLKQMFTYNIQFGSGHAVLFYPGTGLKNLGRHDFETGKAFTYTHACEVYFAAMFDEQNDINQKVAHEFIDYLTNELPM